MVGRTLCGLPKDQAVTRATQKRIPFLVSEPGSRISKGVRALADTLESSFLKGVKYESSLSRLWATWSRFSESVSQSSTLAATPPAEASASAANIPAG